MVSASVEVFDTAGKIYLVRELELLFFDILEYTPGEVAPRLKSWNLRSGMSSPKPGTGRWHYNSAVGNTYGCDRCGIVEHITVMLNTSPAQIVEHVTPVLHEH